MLTSIALNREDEIFAGIEVPQIQVTLKLNCLESLAFEDEQEVISINNSFPVSGISSRYINPSADDGRWYVLTSEIPYSPDTTRLTIVIEDENDNWPIFVNPFANDWIIGYPDSAFADQIMPPNLIVVQAIDADAGINAKIQYSVAANDHFQINPETGVISPTKNSMLNVNSIDLDVTATDRNGSTDGNPTTTTLKIHKLGMEYITVITLETEELLDAESVVDDIFERLRVHLIVLNSAVIPIQEKSRSSASTRVAGQINVLKMYVYGIDANNEFINTVTVQE